MRRSGHINALLFWKVFAVRSCFSTPLNDRFCSITYSSKGGSPRDLVDIHEITMAHTVSEILGIKVTIFIFQRQMHFYSYETGWE